MSSDAPQEKTNQPATATTAQPTVSISAPPTLSNAAPPATKLNPWLALMLSLVMGAVAWGLLLAFDPVFEVPVEFHIVAMGAPQVKVDALLAAVERTNCKNATLYVGVLGALLAASLAAARRCVIAIAIAAPLGLLLGGLAGWIGSVVHVQWSMALGQDELMRTAAVQATVLGGLGLAAGLAFAASYRRPALLVIAGLGGLAAGAVAGAMYPLGMSVFMPTINTEPLIPLEATSRLIWIELVAALVGLFVPLATHRKDS